MTATMRFGAAMAVINLLLRPLSSFLLYRIVQDRAGALGSYGLPTAFESLFGGRRSPYEDIDQPPETDPSDDIDPEYRDAGASGVPEDSRPFRGMKATAPPNEGRFTGLKTSLAPGEGRIHVKASTSPKESRFHAPMPKRSPNQSPFVA